MTINERYANLKSSSFYQLLSRFSILFALFVLFAITTGNFLMPENLFTITLQVAIYALMAAGMAPILISGAIDLSAGSIVGLAGIVCAIMLRNFGLPIPVAILASLAVGLLCGVLNGVLVSYLKLLPFIATLGTMWIFRGFTDVFADGQPVTIRNAQHPEVGEIVRFIGSGRIWNTIPVAIIIVVILSVIVSVILNKTVLGRNIFATGSNPEAARLSGINTRKTTIYAYLIGGTMCGMAGVLITARLTSGQVSSGTGYEARSNRRVRDRTRQPDRR